MAATRPDWTLDEAVLMHLLHFTHVVPDNGAAPEDTVARVRRERQALTTDPEDERLPTSEARRRCE